MISVDATITCRSNDPNTSSNSIPSPATCCHAGSVTPGAYSAFPSSAATLDSAILCPTRHAEACYAVENFLDRDPLDIFHMSAERGFAVRPQCPAEWPLSEPLLN